MSESGLRRALGLRQGVAIVVGTMVGSGIFFKQNVMAKSLGRLDLILLVWLAGGVISLLGGLVYAELAAMIPESGGAYVYLREAWGRCPAFLAGWTDFFFARSASTGALAVAAATLLGCQGATLPAVAIVIIALLAGWNVVGVEGSGRLQDIALFFKVSGLVLVTGLPLLYLDSESFLASRSVPATPAWAAAFLAVLWAYDGWYNVTTVAEEMQEPQRQVPRALLVGVGLTMVLYLAINLGIHASVPMEELAASATPAADMVSRLAGPIGGRVLNLFLLISVLGTLNAGLLCGPRIFFAMARDGLAPRAFATVHDRYATPHRAIIAYSVWSTVLVVAGEYLRGKESLFDLLTNYVIFGIMVFSALTALAIYVLRARQPERERPYRCWGYPATPALFLASLLWILGLNFWERPFESTVGLGLIAAGLPYFVWMQRKNASTTTD